MDRNELVDELRSLIQLDIDAVHAYRQAITEISTDDIRSRLDQFRADHERHVRDLSSELTSLGGSPPKLDLDFKGYVIKGFTSLRSMMGIEGALKAMKGNESLTKSKYESAAQKDFPDSVKKLIDRNYQDERLHLEYITRVLDARPWESAGAHV